VEKKVNKKEEMAIAQSVLKSIPDDQLIACKKFFDNFGNYKKQVKLYNTYIEGVEQSLENTKNGRIYVNYNIDGTVTGRLSNSGATIGRRKADKIGVSFHTLPRTNEDFDVNIRDYVVAPEGHDFITIDMKAMELSVLAHVANEKNMIHAFESGIDLHSYSAGLTFNKDPEDVTKLERQIAKEVSFLTVYGGTAYTLASKRNISEEAAEEIINNWMSAFPGVPRYMQTVRDYIEQFAYAKTLFGRYRHLPNINSPFRKVRQEAFRQGLNFTIQSPANDILLCGLLGTVKEFEARGMKSKIIGTVHDSIEAISPKEETDEAVRILADQLRNYQYMKKNFNIYLRVPL
jgi:DNA polymerase-1